MKKEEKKRDQKAEEALSVKFKDPEAQVSAKDARALLDAKAVDTVDEQALEAYESLQKAIKTAALSGQSYATVNIGATHHHPDVRKAVEGLLTKAGFKYEVQGIQGYIYW